MILGKERSTPFTQFLDQKQIEYHFMPLGSMLSWPSLIIKVRNWLIEQNPDLVHTHLKEGSLLGLSAAFLAGIKCRLSTRHHSTFHHRYFPRAVLYDQLINRLSTRIIAISPNVKKVLEEREKVKTSKIELIPHGFDLTAFESVPSARVNYLKEKYRLREQQPVIGCISRYFELKGLQYLIPAFIKLKKDYPNACLLLFNAKGPYTTEIQKHLSKLEEDDYREIIFEEDLFAIYQLLDVYVHVPIDPEIEAFGQTYVEALASSKACVFTLSGIAHEFVMHEYNALQVPYQNSELIYLAIKRILEEEGLKRNLEKNAAASVSEYGIDLHIDRLVSLYRSLG